MQIGGAAMYLAPAASSLPARSVVPGASVDTASSRPAQSPSVSAQSPTDEQTAGSAETTSASGQAPRESPQQQRIEQLEIAKLVSRDQEVRAHEQAHAAVGGAYAGAPTYTFTRGPDGKRYAAGGEVSIDVSAVPNDPEATLRKMEIVLRAALAPAEPSAQDLRVAGQAQAQMTQARAELAAQQRDAAEAGREKPTDETEGEEKAGAATENSSASAAQVQSASPSLEVYRRLGESGAATPLVDIRA